MTTRFGSAIASALLIVTMGSASAADMPMKAAPPVAPAPTWTGCYLDGGVGYSVWNNDQTLTGPFGAGGTLVTSQTTRSGGNGWLGRFGGGCDWQLSGEWSKWVIGAFADYDVVSASGTFVPNEVIGVPGGGFSQVNANARQNGTYYVGARVGYIALPGLLTYVDGGWTGTRFSQGNLFQTAFGTPLNFAYPGWSNNNGWFVGGGTEYLLPWFNGLFLRSEYRYSSYGNKDLAEFNTLTGIADGNIQHVKTIDQTVTTGLVWKFNWGSPLVAKY